MQDLLRDLEQLVFGHLEQLVARIGLEDVGQRLGRVPGTRQVGALHHPLDLVPEQRNVARVAVVGGRGEQAEEAVLADHLALGVEALDPDEIQIHRAVHRRAGVRLGDHQRRRIARAAPDFRRQGSEAARGGARRALAAEQAERRALDPAQLIAVAVADQVVAAVAEEGEVVVGDPRQERLRLLQVVGVDHLGAVLQVGECGVDLAEHRLPVLDCRAHVAERALELGADRLQPLRIALAVDLDVHERFEGGFAAIAGRRIQHRLERAVGAAPHRDHRVDGEVDQEPEAVERHARRIHQERHVVGHHLDDGVGRLPAVLLDLRIVHPHLGMAGRAVLAEAQVRERGAVQIQWVAIDQVGRRHRPVIVAHERIGEPRQRIVELIVQTVGHAFEQVGLLVLQPGRHGSSPIGDRSASSTDRKLLTKHPKTGARAHCGSAPGSPCHERARSPEYRKLH